MTFGYKIITTISSINFKRSEIFLFLVLLLINLIPVVAFEYFPTLDGPAHLYNSQVIKHLILNDSQIINEFYQFNSFPVPNWITHALLIVFNTIFPAAIAEKCLLIIFLLGFPLVFRKLILSVNPNNALLSYIAFPLAYNHTFSMGFLSFNISLILMLIVLKMWLEFDETSFSGKKTAQLTLVFIVFYFSHLFVFGLTLMCIGIHTIYLFVINVISDKKNFTLHLAHFNNKAITLAISAFIPLVLSGLYLSADKGVSEGNFEYKSFTYLIDRLIHFSPFILYSEKLEGPYMTTIIILLFTLMVYSIVSLIITKNNKTALPTKKSIYEWMIFTIFILVMYFIIPDVLSNAGFISVRLGVILFIIFSVWIAIQKFPFPIKLISCACILYCHIISLTFYYKSSEMMNKFTNSIMLASEHIKDDKIVYPILTFDNWLFRHFSNYMGTERPLIILENYECDQDHFPLVWNENFNSSKILSIETLSEDFKLSWVKNDNQLPTNIDYVFILGNFKNLRPDHNSLIGNFILNDYELEYSNEHCELYKLKL